MTVEQKMIEDLKCVGDVIDANNAAALRIKQERDAYRDALEEIANWSVVPNYENNETVTCIKDHAREALKEAR